MRNFAEQEPQPLQTDAQRPWRPQIFLQTAVQTCSSSVVTLLIKLTDCSRDIDIAVIRERDRSLRLRMRAFVLPKRSPASITSFSASAGRRQSLPAIRRILAARPRVTDSSVSPPNLSSAGSLTTGVDDASIIPSWAPCTCSGLPRGSPPGLRLYHQDDPAVVEEHRTWDIGIAAKHWQAERTVGIQYSIRARCFSTYPRRGSAVRSDASLLRVFGQQCRIVLDLFPSEGRALSWSSLTSSHH